MRYAIILLLTLSVFVLGCATSPYADGEVEKFAKCLTDSDTKMYGAFWCPHCANTKKRFGEAFQYVNYVECDPRGKNSQSELCLEMDIEGYDTWIFADGSRVTGEPSFEELSSGSGCAMPVLKE